MKESGKPWSKLAMPLLFFNISTSIRLLMVGFLFSCVIFAQRIISGWLLFFFLHCFSLLFPISSVDCRRLFFATILSTLLLLDDIFIVIFLFFLHHRSIKNRNDRRSSDGSNLIHVPTHNFSSRIARDKNCFSISTVKWRQRRFLHSVFNVNVNQFKYSEKHRRARWRRKERRKSAVSETSMGY